VEEIFTNLKNNSKIQVTKM